MCLVAWAIGQHPRYPWLLASNRDEYFDRPAEPMRWWRPANGDPELLGGRDASAGGTWLALNRTGRLALVTNVREPGRHDAASPSRGALVVQALCEAAVHDVWLGAVAGVPRNGFNLLVAELADEHFSWIGNRPARSLRASAGLWGLSNAALDTPWPKVRQLKARLADALAVAGAADSPPAAGGTETLVSAVFSALGDRRSADDAALPRTGVPLDRERQLSPAFIAIPGPDRAAGSGYGTRCSTVVLVERLGTAQGGGRCIHVHERSYDRHGAVSGEVVERFTVPTSP